MQKNVDKKLFYRISNEETHQGVWYDINGNFTGFIHDKFNFCKNNTLAMDFDPELKGYLSAADNRDVLDKWFSEEDIKKLQEYGWYIHVYESDDYWFYERFQHYVINQSTMRLVEKIILT